MKHFDFPVDATDFIFVEHWDSDDRFMQPRFLTTVLKNI